MDKATAIVSSGQKIKSREEKGSVKTGNLTAITAMYMLKETDF